MFKIKLETPRRLLGKPDAIERWQRSVPVAMAMVLAEASKERIQGRGEILRAWVPANHPNRLVSPRYPGAEKGRETRSGARKFRDSEAARRAFGGQPRKFSPSGGMWGGESIVSRGRAAAEALFRGRSEGQDPGFFRYKSGRVVARGRKVDNALKAWTVLEKAGVNLLELADDEFAAVEAALTATLGKAVVSGMGFDVKLTGAPTTSHPVFRRMVAQLT